MKHRRSGFTLIEMLVTVALLGVITVLSVTALGPLQARYNRRQAADLVASTAARAQLLARETGRCHALQVYRAGVSVSAPEPVPEGQEGDRLRLVRRTTADCEREPNDTVNPDALEHLEWVRMPGRARVRIQTGSGKTRPEWRPNSRLRVLLAEAELRVVPTSGAELAIRMMANGPVCVSERLSPLEDCP